jgi:ribosomal protein S18 acetylase RimI-like enzyme
MRAICLHDKQTIEAFLRQQTFHHLYEIGDLDDFFWQYTIWYALQDQDAQINQLALLYTGGVRPVLLGLSEDLAGLYTLIQSILPLLPREFDMHLSGDSTAILESAYHLRSYGLHYKMALVDPKALDRVDTTQVVQLTFSDLEAMEELYRISYPGNWFDARMLETGHYFGIYVGKQLASIAGIHTYSPRYKVAVLGNVTTRPDYRKMGLGTATCAKLCQVLSQSVEHIGLNVKADNTSAIAVYERLGFQCAASYREFHCTLK